MVLCWLPIIALIIEKTKFPIVGDVAIYSQLGMWTLLFLLSLHLYKFNLTLYLFDVSLALPLSHILDYPTVPLISASILTVTFHRLLSGENVGCNEEQPFARDGTTSLFLIILMASIMTVDLIAVLFLYPVYPTTVLEKLSISCLLDLGDNQPTWTSLLGSGDFLSLGIVYLFAGQRPIAGTLSVLLSVWLITSLPIHYPFYPATVFILTIYFLFHLSLTWCEAKLFKRRVEKTDLTPHLLTDEEGTPSHEKENAI